MKTFKNQFKSLFFLLVMTVSLVGCSSDDDNNDINEKPGLKEEYATAVIQVDNQTIQFSTKTNNSFATIIDTKIGENETKQLIIVMMDDNSDAMIVTQAAPAPTTTINYDLSKTITDDYFFTAGVAINGKNSSDANVYGVGLYQHEGDVVRQSKGTFKITSISSTNIKGTFDVTLYNSYVPNDTYDAKELTVTEGEFDLPIIELDEEDLGDLDLE